MDGGGVCRRGRWHLLQNLTSDSCSTHQKTPYKQIWIKLANIYSDYLSFFLGGGTWGVVGAPNQKSDFRFVFYARKKPHAQKIDDASWKFEFWPAKLMIHPTVRRLWMVRIPFATNRNLSVFALIQRELDAPGVLSMHRVSFARLRFAEN